MAIYPQKGLKKFQCINIPKNWWLYCSKLRRKLGKQRPSFLILLFGFVICLYLLPTVRLFHLKVIQVKLKRFDVPCDCQISWRWQFQMWIHKKKQLRQIRKNKRARNHRRGTNATRILWIIKIFSDQKMFHTSSFIYVRAIFLNQSFFSARDKNRNLSINRFQLIGLITLFIFILMVIFLEFKSVNVCSFYASEPNHQLMRTTKEAKLMSFC